MFLALAEQLSHGARDHELLPGRNDLHVELAEETQPLGDRLPDVGSVLAHAAGECEYVDASQAIAIWATAPAIRYV